MISRLPNHRSSSILSISKTFVQQIVKNSQSNRELNKISKNSPSTRDIIKNSVCSSNDNEEQLIKRKFPPTNDDDNGGRRLSKISIASRTNQHRDDRLQRFAKNTTTISSLEQSGFIDRNEFLDMLRHFRQRLPYTNERYLSFATYYAWKLNLEREFVEVVDEWFRQARHQIFDRRSSFKVTSQLCNLGKLNSLTKGVLVEKLRWSNVEYLMRRMSEIGFDRSAYGVTSAASGLQNLYQFRTADDRDQQRRVSAEFLEALRTYLNAKTPTDPDWDELIRVTAPYLLNVFSYVLPDRPPSPDLLLRLYQLTKLGFDQIRRGRRRNRSFGRREIKTIVWFGRAIFLRGWTIGDNNEEFDGVWRSYLEAAELVLDESMENTELANELSFQFFRGLIGSAERLDRIEDFWPIFPTWCNGVERLCERASRLINNDADDSNALETVEVQLGTLVYVCGQFAAKCSRRGTTMDVNYRRSFDTLLASFESALIARPIVNVDVSTQARFLTGVRDLKKEFDLRYEPSPAYFDYLRDWSVHQKTSATTRNRRSPSSTVCKNRHSSNSASKCALLLHLLREMNVHHRVPPSTVRELTVLFLRSEIADDSLEALSFFSMALANYRQFAMDDEQMRRRYFEKVRFVLEESWPSERSSEAASCLSSICQLVYAKKLMKEWTTIREICEKRIRQVCDNFTPKQAHFLVGTFKFEDGLMKRLSRISEDYVGNVRK